MVTPGLQKIIVVVVVVLAVIFMGYELFTGAPASTSPVATGEPVVGQEILDLVAKLKVLNFDTSLFSSDLMNNLVDRSPQLLPEPQGRPNPFAAIGTDR